MAVPLQQKKRVVQNRTSIPSPTTKHQKEVNSSIPRHIHQGKNLVQWVASLCQITQSSRNEQNEGNRCIVERMDVLHEEMQKQTEVLRNGFAEISKTMEQSFTHCTEPVARVNESDVNRHCIPMDFVDACAAMVRYAYALSGQGKKTPLHLFPSRISQVKLFETVTRILLETQTASSRLNGILTWATEKKNSNDEQLQQLNGNVDMGEVVKHILMCRIEKNGRETQCIFLNEQGQENKEKNTICDRLLDQRRRYHESITLPLVLSWLRFAGFAEYDSSKALKKQSPKFFEEAADALERNEEGACAYFDEKIYGRSYQASCSSLHSISETFGDNTLGYVKKFVSDDDDLANVILKLESEIGCHLLGKRKHSHSFSNQTAFYSHHLAFVFTKVSDAFIERMTFESNSFCLLAFFNPLSTP